MKKSGTRCGVCKLGWLKVEKRELTVAFGDRAYLISQIPGHVCDNPIPNARTGKPCGWKPDKTWGNGDHRGGMTWKRAWSLHSRAFLDTHPRCNRCPEYASESHHRVYRSQGGSDEWENLEALCKACHEAEHRGNGRDED